MALGINVVEDVFLFKNLRNNVLLPRVMLRAGLVIFCCARKLAEIIKASVFASYQNQIFLTKFIFTYYQIYHIALQKVLLVLKLGVLC